MINFNVWPKTKSIKKLSFVTKYNWHVRYNLWKLIRVADENQITYCDQFYYQLINQ